MGFAIPAIMTGISALTGLFGNRANTSTSKVDNTTDSKFNNSSMPAYDAKTQAMRDMMINYYMDRLQSNDDFFDSYTKQGVNNINQGADASNNIIGNLLASRGIKGSMAGYASILPQVQRQSQISSFLNTIPQLKDQRAASNLASAGGFLSSLPVGQTQTGTSSQHQYGTTTNTQPGNMMGGLFQGLGGMLAGLYGQGAFGQNSQNSLPTVGYNPGSSTPNWFEED